VKILIELPTWLGDSVMTTPAIENLTNNIDNVQISLIGSDISLQAIKYHPRVDKIYFLDKNYFKFFKKSTKLDHYDVFISFRSSFRSKLFKFLISSDKKFQFNKRKYSRTHQVEKYNDFVNDCLKINTTAGPLKLFAQKKDIKKTKKLLGINPGASYGNAKRWYPIEFAKVASALSDEYNIVIFGGPEETNIASDIEKILIQKGLNNYQNLAGMISIDELINQISNLDLFITGDSGPMHLAAAFGIPTVSIFGPTKDYETSQWMNEKSKIIKKNLDCQPCMQRTCPLKHHNCMKMIKASEVLEEIKKFDYKLNS
jgi:heptosyltransferase II